MFNEGPKKISARTMRREPKEIGFKELRLHQEAMVRQTFWPGSVHTCMCVYIYIHAVIALRTCYFIHDAWLSFSANVTSVKLSVRTDSPIFKTLKLQEAKD